MDDWMEALAVFLVFHLLITKTKERGSGERGNGLILINQIVGEII